MKFLNIFLISICSSLILLSCSEKNKEISWKIETQEIKINNFEIIDISKDFYNTNIPISEFKKKYPFFLDNKIEDKKYESQRIDSTELNIYKQITNKINFNSIKTQLDDLFKHIKYYYPKFSAPSKIYLYSSFCQDYMSPITYSPKDDCMFIALDCFLGEGNKYYDMLRIERYLQKNMDQKYLISKVAREIILKYPLINYNETSQNFLSSMIFEGKIITLMDALMPNIETMYKIGYTKEQMDWAYNNEPEIWDYFIENNLIFSDEISLSERFLSIAPFSKFYNNADQESPGQIGIWVGWRICKEFYNKNQKIKISDFLSTPSQTILEKSNYKP